MEKLVTENSGLIWAVARRFLGRGVETDDLYQLGCMGFLKAVDGFDLSFGTQFSTYAVPKIAGEIRRFLRDDGAVKVSRSIKERAAAIRSCRNQLASALGREPTIQEISRQTGFSPEDIALAETATASTESIQQENGEEGFSLEDVLTDTESEDQMLEKIALRQAITELPQRERSVVELRYFHCLTQQRVAKILNVSQVQVSRIEKRAIALLHEMLS
ncbi:MAG: sigma-70 family RNA polymerase sigma factor [Candidatus Faecousia sp.]|nr:sigma-70 family RNA polymerase sigma factor [Candidatus Faecousia sp.]